METNVVDTDYRAIRTPYPGPLDAVSGSARLGTLALPGELLSGLSILAFLVLLVIAWYAGHSQLHGTDTGEIGWPHVAAVSVAGALSWWIFVVVRMRPGRLWTRWWALLLASTNSAIAVETLIGSTSASPALMHGLVAASVGATLLLTMRLLKVMPQSGFAQHIGPLAMVAFILLAVFATQLTLPVYSVTTEVKVARALAAISNYLDDDKLSPVQQALVRKCLSQGRSAESVVTRVWKQGQDADHILELLCRHLPSAQCR